MKRVVKGIIRLIALVLVSPLAGAEVLARRACGRDVWFNCHSELLSLVPGKTGQFLRNAYWHLTLRRCPMDCCFLFATLFTHSEAEVGNGVYMGARCIIGMATIGDHTMLADNVHILSGKHQHATSDPAARFQDQPQVFTRVHIGENCWIGTNAIVMADIGDNCVIGAGTIVVKPIAENSVAVGNPARVIRAISEIQTSSP